MIQDQTLRRYPGVTTAAVNMTVYFRGRTTEGTGTFNAISGVTDLVFVYPNGRTDSVTHEAIREAVITHLLNSSLTAWWSPENQTPEAALRAALGALDISAGAGSVVVMVFFDGQFGPVSVG